MQKTIKWVFLFLLVGLPLVIYLFLQGFGENRFDIPVFYESEGIPEIEDCSAKSYPYNVEFGDFESLRCDVSYAEEVARIVVLLSAQTDDDQVFINNMESLVARVDNYKKYSVVSYVADSLKSSGLGNFAEANNCFSIKPDTMIREFGRCTLFLGSKDEELEYRIDRDIVLVDKEGIIRGYYNALSIEDIDRLVTELRILIKND